jgi:gas vesicle protein
VSNKYINGFIAGGLIGAAAAIMLSSRSDDNMKKKMMSSGKNIADMATKIMPGVKSR